MRIPFQVGVFLVLFIATMGEDYLSANNGTETIYHFPKQAIPTINTQETMDISVCADIGKQLCSQLDLANGAPPRDQYFKNLESSCNTWERATACHQQYRKLTWYKFLAWQCSDTEFTPTPLEKCIEDALPAGIGRILNYCLSDSLEEEDFFNGMERLHCHYILIPSLIFGPVKPSEATSREHGERMDMFYMGIIGNCTLTTTPLSDGAESLTHSFY